MWDNLNVDGFHFDNASDYSEAKKESEAIEYICSKMDVNDPEVAFKVYYKLLERQNLHTIVGFTFLKSLRDRILESHIINEKELKAINAPKVDLRPVEAQWSAQTGDETSLEIDSLSSDKETAEAASVIPRRDKSKEKKLKVVADYYRNKYKKSFLVIAALIVVILVLFGITYYRGNLNLDDAEVMVQDKYAAWAEELAEKEAQLDLRTRELNAKEIELNERELGMPGSERGSK
ncbi:MAG: hypothetical protein K6G81_04800 [Lachnospiraceae bacterium]|nr:hypothetical protein [Lachnospiraceae bacterium]